MHLHAALSEPFGRRTPAILAAAPTMCFVGRNKYNSLPLLQRNIPGEVMLFSNSLSRSGAMVERGNKPGSPPISSLPLV
jgi:hypothetical protein